MVPASFSYSDADGFYFMDQESFETLTLSQEMIGDAQDFLAEGLIIQVHKYNGNPIGHLHPITRRPRVVGTRGLCHMGMDQVPLP
jgi:elongation factor P